MNRDTVEAESGGQTTVRNLPWKEFLRGVLADSFVIRRSNARFANQGREAMIGHIERPSDTPRLQFADPTPGARREVDQEQVILSDDETLGVVTGRVTLGAAHYRNVKVFQRRPQHDWQCVYWQVSQEPTPAESAPA